MPRMIQCYLSRMILFVRNVTRQQDVSSEYVYFFFCDVNKNGLPYIRLQQSCNLYLIMLSLRGKAIGDNRCWEEVYLTTPCQYFLVGKVVNSLSFNKLQVYTTDIIPYKPCVISPHMLIFLLLFED